MTVNVNFKVGDRVTIDPATWSNADGTTARPAYGKIVADAGDGCWRVELDLGPYGLLTLPIHQAHLGHDEAPP